MVDVSEKPPTVRTARAAARVVLGQPAFEQLKNCTLRKGDALAVAKVAGVMGAKRTSSLIPLCHAVSLSSVTVDMDLDEVEHAVAIQATATATGPTGVEMEALTAASVAALTLYDMCKAVNPGIRIEALRLVSKTGGKRGDYYGK